MLSLQEAVAKDEVKPQLRAVEKCLDRGRFHPELASVYNVESGALRQQLRETLSTIPLHEFLAKSGTTGIAGAAYMVPDKVHDTLIGYTRRADLVPLIGHVVAGWAGGDLKVDIVNDLAYAPKEFSSGGKIPAETVETAQATITPVSFGIAPRITRDLVEDANFEMVEYHLQRASLAMAKKSSNMALTVLKTATDGWGTVNSSNTGDADETRLVNGTTMDIVSCVRALGDDEWHADTMVITPEAYGHSVSTQAAETGWQVVDTTPGYDVSIGTLDVLISHDASLHASTDAQGAAMTNCITLIFSRENALLTGRKRWLQINNYSEPVRDLAGCTVTARQDSVTLYDDSVYVLTET